MAFDPDPAATENPTTGVAPPAAWGDILNANAAALGGATSFTPTWNSSGTAPAYGTSTVDAVWREVGNWMDVIVNITFATATFGTGSYTWTIPNSRSAAFTQMCGTARLIDTGTPGNIDHGLVIAATTTLSIFQAGSTTTVGAGSPFTWANTDVIRFNARIWCA